MATAQRNASATTPPANRRLRRQLALTISIKVLFLIALQHYFFGAESKLNPSAETVEQHWQKTTANH